MADNDTTSESVRIDAALLERLRVYKDRYGPSIKWIVEAAILEWLKKHEK